jgi:acyl-CoA synthetase (NDP forming)
MGNRLAKDLVNAFEQHGKPVYAVWGSPVGTEVAYTEILLKSGVPVFRTFANCVRALRAQIDHAEFRARYRSPFADVVTQRSSAAEQVLPLLRQGRALTETESKRVLQAYGIPTTRDVMVQTAQEATAAVRELGGTAVLKVVSAQIAHKSDLGLVRVGVSTKDAGRVHDEILAAAQAGAPGATIDGVAVCEQVSDGVECVVGVAQDPLFGPVVMAGMGGVFLEVLQDVTHRVPPFDAAEARRMVDELRGAALLRGVRGSPPADIDALVDVIMKVQCLALDLDHDLAELDINPLLVRSSGAVALDALLIPREASA